MLTMATIVVIIVLLLLALNIILAPFNPYTGKNNPFECGFLSFLWQNRVQFSIAFFLFALLFLLFDLEVLLVFPYFVSAYTNKIQGLISMILFLLVLVAGFAFEYGRKALVINSKQLQITSSHVNKNQSKCYVNIANSQFKLDNFVKSVIIMFIIPMLDYVTSYETLYEEIESKYFPFTPFFNDLHITWPYIIVTMCILQIIFLLVTTLLEVAFITVAERKTMASMQRRLGPNIVGFFGILQAFADAVKLLLKEYISPTQANKALFLLGPVVTLVFSLLGYSVVPYAPGIMISDFNLGILYMLAMSSLSTYGILLSGWSANSKYAFLGSLRSTAQLISYELILSSAILLVILFSGSLSLMVNIESQRAVWYILPLFPVFIIFFIGSIAETNRAPFDLVEAESELVSGYMTEHAAVVFVFFFLAEYASILLICVLISMLFIGGYLYLFDLSLYVQAVQITTEMPQQLELLQLKYDASYVSYITHYINYNLYIDTSFAGNLLLDGLKHSMTLGLKSSIMVFAFIWVRASYPRVRYDQLMSFCWTVLLPIIIAVLIVFPCVLHNFNILPNNILLL